MTCDNNPEVMFNTCLHEALKRYSASAKHVTRGFSADIEILENFEGFLMVNFIVPATCAGAYPALVLTIISPWEFDNLVDMRTKSLWITYKSPGHCQTLVPTLSYMLVGC
jgi:hypothetical protein